MGYEDTLWRIHRHQFPVTESLVYLNHAAVAPLVKPAADALIAWSEDALRFGSLHYDHWCDAYAGLRVAAARLLNADRTEIAIVKNTSEGISTIALGMDWHPGDRIVVFREEFPANYYPWVRLEKRGVQLCWHSICDPLEEIDNSCKGARLLAISFVNYLSGRRMDLDALGEICHRHNTLFLVDAIQGLGAFPVDVRRSRIHFLSADGHKWMFGPEGCGILYIRKDLQDTIDPVEFGWTNVAAYADYSSRDMTLRPDAGRYECGSLNTPGIFGLRAAVEFLNTVGVSQISQAVGARGAQIAEGVQAKGYEVLGGRTPETGSGIVTFRKEGIDSRLLVSQLKENGVIAAPRQGYVRTSPHFYISPDNISRLLDLLP